MNRTQRPAHRSPLLFRILPAALALLMAVGSFAACRPSGGPGGDGTTVTDTQSGPADTLPGGTSADTQGSTNPPATDGPATDAPATETDESGNPVTPPETLPETEPPVISDGEPDTPPETSSPAETDAPAYDPEKHPGDTSLYDGVFISAVHGTGKKGAEAVVSHGFVQLYNSTSKDISLKGASLYYKTEGANPFAQWPFPEGAVIPAGGYYLVRANAPTGVVEENLILSIEHFDAEWDTYIDNKEIRLVFAPSGWLIGTDEDVTDFDDANSVFVATESYEDSVHAVNDLSRNKMAIRTALKDYSSYHVVNLTKANTPDLRRYCPVTAAGKENTVVGSRLLEVEFSRPAGIYPTAFNLSLTAPEGYTIYYTTDGSDPSDAKNSSRRTYGSAIRLSDTSSVSWGPVTRAWANYSGGASPSVSTQLGAHVIKAYAVKGSESTGVYTGTYFITPNLEQYNVPVISISLPLSEMIGSQGFYSNYTGGGSITDPRVRAEAVMEVFDEEGARVGNSIVELAVSGNGSSGFRMKSMRIYYKGALNEDAGLHNDLNYDFFDGLAVDNNGAAITSFSRLLLRNSGNDCGTSYIRDAYMQRVSAGLNVDVMASASTLVFINGEFWGVYNMRERYSPEYVENHYGVDKENVCVIESDYSQVHTNTNADFVLGTGVEGDQDPFNELVQYMRDHDLANTEHYAHVCEQLDIDSFIDMWVIRLFFVARDWPENNIKVWRNKNPDDPSGMDTKWHFVLLDMDMGLSFYDFTTETENFFWAFDSGSVTGTIMRALMKNQEFRSRFFVRYYELVTEHFTPEYLTEEFEALYAERNPLMPLQRNRWSGDGASVTTWEAAAGRIRRFITQRQDYALNHLYSRFGISEEEILTMSQKKLTVNFHSGRADVTLNGEAIESGHVIKLEDGQTLTLALSAVAKEGYTVTSITFTDREGQSQTVEGTRVTLQISNGGTVSITAKRNDTNLGSGEGTIVAGATYLFYLTENGDLYAWGDNRHGVLGLGTAGGIVKEPTFVMGDVAKVVTTHANAYENDDTTFSTAILTTDGRLLTVGRNTCGQLGHSGTADVSVLTEIELDAVVVDVSLGHDHMLVLDENGTMWGIGANNYGALGPVNVGGVVSEFVKVAEEVAFMSAGRRSTAYVTDDGQLWGLGDNRWKKMSQSHGDTITTPAVIAKNIEFLASGEHQILAVDHMGKLYYAGWRDLNSFNQGPGNNPTFAHLLDNVVKADVYFGNMVILTDNGDAYVYGINTYGGIGDSAVVGGTPKKIISGVKDVAAGYGFTAYLMEDGRILVQGDNTYGQGGNGTVGGAVKLGEADI